jgi:hypothetical protein
MIPTLPTNIRNEHPLSSLFTGNADARLTTPTSCAMSAQKHFAAPPTVPAARPDPDLDASVLARLKALPTLGVIHAPKPAAKSP